MPDNIWKKSLSTPTFEYKAPQNEFKGLISVPHPGETIPISFEKYLVSDETIFQKDYDYRIDELLDKEFLQKNGIGVLSSKIARICVDLNRDRHQALLYWKKNTHDELVVKSNPSGTEADQLLAEFYDPYFQQLEKLLGEMAALKQNQKANCVDLHSMPSHPNVYHFKKNPHQKRERRPDFCLSDLAGKSCSKKYLEFARRHLSGREHSVQINDPYVGGFVSHFIARFPSESFQLEINRDLYMDEKQRTFLQQDLDPFKELLNTLFVPLFELDPITE